jgi:molecular chaperone GrpE
MTKKQEIQEEEQEDLKETEVTIDPEVEITLKVDDGDEVKKLRDQLIRSVADQENFRKRAAKQIDDAGKFAINNFAKDLIDVLENLYLATDNMPEDESIKNEALTSILQGVEMTKVTLVNVFEKYGIRRVFPAVGDNFDHNFHQAVSHIAQPDFVDNAIVNVMRAGYILNDRLIRPAMVVVSKTV